MLEAKYSFRNRIKNPEFKKGVITIEDRRKFKLEAKPSNLVKYTISPKKENTLLLYIKTLPKWLTNLNKSLICTETGEITADGTYETNEIKQSNSRKIKKLSQFCNIYDPMYASKKVSVLFYTFTRMNFANILFSRLLDDIKYRFTKMLNLPIRAFIWVLEVSAKFHSHYHLCVVIDRINIKKKKIPVAMMFEKLWGQRTQVRFVEKGIRRYLSKYFAKEQYRLCFINDKGQLKAFRSFGMSKIK